MWKLAEVEFTTRRMMKFYESIEYLKNTDLKGFAFHW